MGAWRAEQLLLGLLFVGGSVPLQVPLQVGLDSADVLADSVGEACFWGCVGSWQLRRNPQMLLSSSSEFRAT